jgi:hypothetical protein
VPGDHPQLAVAGHTVGHPVATSDGFSGTTRTHEAGGQIQESWMEWDQATAWQQLGLGREILAQDSRRPAASNDVSSNDDVWAA